MNETYQDIRPSPLAGRWYPADRTQLEAMLARQLDQAQPATPPRRIIGLLAPHAGLVYSGPVAAYAFKLLADLTPDVVAIVGPSHHFLPGRLITTGHDAYQTPLGTVPVAADLIQQIDAQVPLTTIRNDDEHSLEMELLFLQYVLKKPFRLLPIMLMDQTPHTAHHLSTALADVLAGQRALLVASSDLSHFYTQAEAEILDQALLAEVSAYQPDHIFKLEEEGRGYACGRGAIAAVMWAAQRLGAAQADLLHYATSADVGGDPERVVGYSAGVFYTPAN